MWRLVRLDEVPSEAVARLTIVMSRAALRAPTARTSSVIDRLGMAGVYG
jgi:hypothetical protein